MYCSDKNVHDDLLEHNCSISSVDGRGLFEQLHCDMRLGALLNALEYHGTVGGSMSLSIMRGGTTWTQIPYSFFLRASIRRVWP